MRKSFLKFRRTSEERRLKSEKTVQYIAKPSALAVGETHTPKGIHSFKENS
jgi:hypothetical protein